MNIHRINLLPENCITAHSRDTSVRIVIVAVSLVTALSLIGAALLVPTYFYLGNILEAKQAELASLEASRTLSDGTSISDRLSRLSNNVSAVTALKNSSSMSGALQKVLAVPRAGITIGKLSYTAGQSNTLVISGVARTRDDLHNYQSALRAAPFILASKLPVSSYAKDVKVPFTITLTLAP